MKTTKKQPDIIEELENLNNDSILDLNKSKDFGNDNSDVSYAVGVVSLNAESKRLSILEFEEKHLLLEMLEVERNYFNIPELKGTGLQNKISKGIEDYLNLSVSQVESRTENNLLTGIFNMLTKSIDQTFDFKNPLEKI